jgi:guanine deaminase
MTSKTVMAHGVFLSDDELTIFRERQSMISHCPLSNFAIHSGICDVVRALRFGVKVGIGTDVSGGYAASMVNACRNTLIASAALKANQIQDGLSTDELVKNIVNKVQRTESEYEPLTLTQVLYLATLGGASGVGLEDKIGNFEIGKDFDALLIDVDVEDGPVDAFLDDYEFLFGEARKQKGTEEQEAEKKVLDMLERFMYCGDDRNISDVYVKGRRIE